MTTCAETDCPFKTFGGWCGLTACIRRNTTTEIGANPVWVIPDDYVKVVRCRDCKYGEPETNGCGEDMVMCQNKQNPIGDGDWLMPPEFYCADGERREANEHTESESA